MNVQSIMENDVQTIGPRETLVNLQNALLRAKVGGLPVVEHGRLVGIASRSDIVKSLKSERDAAMKSIGLPPEFHLTLDDAIDLGEVVGERLERIRVEDVMNRDVVTVSPNDSLQTAAELMASNHFHRLPVVENGHLSGLISSHDIVQLVANGTLKPAAS